MIIARSKDTLLIEKICPICRTVNQATVPTIGYDKWKNGTLIQDAMPTVPVVTREFLITGFCRDCQTKIFGIEEE